MTTLLLSPAERKLKRAEAHHLNPVVSIGAEGATEAVRRELDAALDAHGLIKVRVFSDDRAAREVLFGELSAALSAASPVIERRRRQCTSQGCLSTDAGRAEPPR